MMINSKIIKIIEAEISKFVEQKYFFCNNDILNSIKLEKKNELVTFLEKENIQDISDENIINYIQQPIYKTAYNNFNAIIKVKEEKRNKLENVSYSNAYKCYKCGSNKTSVVYIQTRSCDEPMTAFIKCIKCQNQFVN